MLACESIFLRVLTLTWNKRAKKRRLNMEPQKFFFCSMLFFWRVKSKTHVKDMLKACDSSVSHVCLFRGHVSWNRDTHVSCLQNDMRKTWSCTFKLLNRSLASCAVTQQGKHFDIFCFPPSKLHKIHICVWTNRSSRSHTHGLILATSPMYPLSLGLFLFSMLALRIAFTPPLR
jgi:hypothetical protein